MSGLRRGYTIKEVLRLWLAGGKKKPIAAQLGLDAKTVRRYVIAGQQAGLTREGGEAALSDEMLARVVAAVHRAPERPHGDGWQLCVTHRAELEKLLGRGLRLSKVRRLLARQQIDVPYSTLHRFAVAELGFGSRAPTLPVADGKPGEELQVDTGWVTYLERGDTGRLRRLRAWIFTPNVSRYRFVYPCLQETTASAIEACEAAWEFFGGVFAVLLPDNTKAIVDTADPVAPRIVATFLEYAQSRGFHIDPARVRHPKDKARVERAVRDVRDDCFAGEILGSPEEARERARQWCSEEYGLRRHSTTQRLPREHFEAEEKPCLRPAPTEHYDTPIWAEPKVARDQHAQVARALYSLPRRFIGKRLRARADRSTVRFYDGATLVKTHPRKPPGGRATDVSDLPPERTAYALRDVTFLQRQAEEAGPAIGRFAAALLATDLPWTRMRSVYRLLSLAKRYGATRVDQACARALDAGMSDIHRLERMLKLAAPPVEATPSPPTIVPARFLRPASDYALPCVQDAINQGED